MMKHDRYAVITLSRCLIIKVTAKRCSGRTPLWLSRFMSFVVRDTCKEMRCFDNTNQLCLMTHIIIIKRARRSEQPIIYHRSFEVKVFRRAFLRCFLDLLSLFAALDYMWFFLISFLQSSVHGAFFLSKKVEKSFSFDDFDDDLWVWAWGWTSLTHQTFARDLQLQRQQQQQQSQPGG